MNLQERIAFLKSQILEIKSQRKQLEAFLMEHRAFIPTCARRPGSRTQLYTSRDLLKHSMNLTACGFRILRTLREIKGITQVKRVICKEIKDLRKLNLQFDDGKI